MFQDLHAHVTTREPASDSAHLAPLVTIGPRLPAVASFPTSAKRWSVCLAVAVCLHATAAAALLGRWDAIPEEVANSSVITIELATLPVAPDRKLNDAAPGPQESEARPQSGPVRPTEAAKPPRQTEIEQKLDPPLQTTAPPPQQEERAPVLPPKPPEKPVEIKKSRPQHASIASAPPHADHKAARAAAPAPGASAHDANAVPSWKSMLVAKLERNKRYPEEAEARGEHGTAELAFRVDRRGYVHHARIARSSGSGILDRATLAMLERASPLPPPPPEVGGAEIPVIVPIRYSAP